MKIIKTASGKQQIKISKSEWENIGKKAGWMKIAGKAKVSDCCGAADRCTTPVGVKNEGPWYSDEQRCPKCKEHCTFVDDEA